MSFLKFEHVHGEFVSRERGWNNMRTHVRNCSLYSRNSVVFFFLTLVLNEITHFLPTNDEFTFRSFDAYYTHTFPNTATANLKLML